MTPQEVLFQYWGFPEFREPQEEIIHSVLQQKNTIALLPTGGGKSLCYQIPALILDGICLVISPLISLMQDQIENLESRGIKAKYIKPGSSQNEIITLFDNVKFDGTKLLYLSPERLQSKLVIDRLKDLNISFIAVDEAHCISEWGHDFRPSYLKLKDIKKTLNNPTIIALTATANQLVLEDIQRQLEIDDVAVFKKSFKRKNLAYQVFELENKNNRLLQIITKMKTPIIVYCNTRKRTKEICDFLNDNQHNATYYHGGLTKEEKDKSFTEWKLERKRIMVATNAFGMGIDKSNVGVVIHMDLPYSIENYFQEAGRAGRGGKKSFAVLLWNQNDISVLKQQFVSALPNLKHIKTFTKKLYQYFEIAEGELPEISYDFDFLGFCNKNSFLIDTSKNTLQILRNNGVIEISNDFYSQSKAKVLVNPNQLDNQHTSKKEKEFIEILLRSYTGLFTDYIKINEFTLATKLGVTSKEILNILKGLDKKGIISFQQKNNLQRIQFLQPREDKYTINKISREISAFINQKENKMNSLIEFIETDVCRNQWLLNYFDEKNSNKCGVCDVCLKKKQKSPINLEAKILALLKQNRYNSQELFTELKVNENILLYQLKEMLKRELIQINTDNKYSINE